MASNRTLVFLVDDDELYLKTAQHNLAQNRALDIKSFTSGEQALSAFKSANKKPNIFVLDYFLSTDANDAASGLEILKKIKQENADVDVIMLSGQEDINVAVNSVKYGAYDYVVKNKSAFIRVQNNIKRITANKIKEAENKKLRKFVIALVIVLSLLAVVSVIFTIDNTFLGLFGEKD